MERLRRLFGLGRVTIPRIAQGGKWGLTQGLIQGLTQKGTRRLTQGWGLGVVMGLLLGLILAIAPLSVHAQFSTPLTLGYPPVQAQSAMATVTPQQLPPEARTTITLIQQGGPFPYTKDGTVFQNRERRLPEKPRGYYQEYTVPTPGSRDRGARRIVTGKGKEFYYTKDHYRTFVRIQLTPSKPKPRAALPSSAG